MVSMYIWKCSTFLGIKVNANQNWVEIQMSSQSEWLPSRAQKIKNVKEVAEMGGEEAIYTAGGIVN